MFPCNAHLSLLSFTVAVTRASPYLTPVEAASLVLLPAAQCGINREIVECITNVLHALTDVGVITAPTCVCLQKFTYIALFSV